MSEFLSKYGATIALIIYVVVLKWRRQGETKEKNKRVKSTADAENMVIAIANGLRNRTPDLMNQVQLMNDLAGDVPDENIYKRVLIDGAATFCETETEIKFTPLKGEHPLHTLATRAVESETKKAKIVRTLKRAGSIGLSILKAAT